MSELNSRITNADDAARVAAETAHSDASTIIDRLDNIRHQLGHDDDVTLSDVYNAINFQGDRMASYFDSISSAFTTLMDFLDLMNINAASNARLTAGTINALVCCDVVLSEPGEGTPDENACSRAGWAILQIERIMAALYDLRNAGVLVSGAIVSSVISSGFPEDALLHAPASDYTAKLASVINIASQSATGGILAHMTTGASDGMLNIIGSSPNIEAALNGLSIFYYEEGFPDEQVSILKSLITTQFLSDVYISDIPYGEYPNDACGGGEEIIVPECTGTASIFSRTLDGATPLPFGSWSGSRSVFYSCPTLDLSFDIDVLNHDDSDSLVATVHQGEAFTSDSDVNYYFRPNDGVTTGEHEFTTCATLLV